jgi:hypothetical protein
LTNTFTIIIGSVNQALEKNSPLRIQAVHFAYGGLSLLTNNVTTQLELEVVSNVVMAALGGTEPVSASLPYSRLYLKILDILVFKPGTQVQIDPAYIIKALGSSPLASHINLAFTLQVMHNAKTSDTATVWFDVKDSQLGTSAKALINSFF